MDKLKFAHLMTYLGCITCRSFTLTEVGEVDQLIKDGVASNQLAATEIEAMLAAMQAGKKIEAIKAYRAMTGLGLIESKNLIEKYWFAQPKPIDN